MKKILSIFIVIIMAVNLSSCNIINQLSDYIKDKSFVAQKDKTEFNKPDFMPFYNEFINSQGEIDRSQTGVVDNYEGCFWLKPEGVISNRVADFDGDDTQEMLVAYTKKTPNQDDYRIYFDMYEYVDGEIKLYDTIEFQSYHKESDESFFDIYLKEFQTAEIFAKASLVYSNNIYILCESRLCESVLGDGRTQNIWFIEYKNDRFQYEAALSQVAGGSAEFSYTDYLFDDGELVSYSLSYSEMYQYFGEGDTPNYDTFGDAIDHFLSPYSLDPDEDVKFANGPYDEEIDFFDSFVETETEEIFTITNEIESYEFFNDSFPTVSYEFEID